MLLHKGGQINNVQLITGVRIVEISQLQNCSVMCAKKGSYCENKNKKKVRGEGSGEICTKNGSYWRSEAFVKIQKKKMGGGGGFGPGVCEQRSEAFVKIQKKKCFLGGSGGRGGGGGGEGGGGGGGSGWM